MQAHSAAQRVLPDGGLGEPLEGAIEIAASCSLADGLPSVARLLADAVKGNLPGTPRPLQVRNECIDDIWGPRPKHVYLLSHFLDAKPHIYLQSTFLLLVPQPEQVFHLQVVNMVGSEAVQAAICQNVLYSRSLLRCAALREVTPDPNCPLTGPSHRTLHTCFACQT